MAGEDGRCTRAYICSLLSSRSLYGIQLDSKEKLAFAVDRVLRNLMTKGMIISETIKDGREEGSAEELLQATQLGVAAFSSSLGPQRAKQMHAGLQISLGRSVGRTTTQKF
jgi:hypothetical protein